jgi:hypothetical protein
MISGNFESKTIDPEIFGQKSRVVQASSKLIYRSSRRFENPLEPRGPGSLLRFKFFLTPQQFIINFFIITFLTN